MLIRRQLRRNYDDESAGSQQQSSIVSTYSRNVAIFYAKVDRNVWFYVMPMICMRATHIPRDQTLVECRVFGSDLYSVGANRVLKLFAMPSKNLLHFMHCPGTAYFRSKLWVSHASESEKTHSISRMFDVPICPHLTNSWTYLWFESTLTITPFSVDEKWVMEYGGANLFTYDDARSLGSLSTRIGWL